MQPLVHLLAYTCTACPMSFYLPAGITMPASTRVLCPSCALPAHRAPVHDVQGHRTHPRAPEAEG